jgi:hypothetical protein
MFALDYNVSMRETHIAPPSSRIIIFVVIFYALIASSLFQGNIIKCLNAQTSIGRINTVDDLFENNYKFVLNHVISASLMQQSGNELSKKLRKIAKNATTVGTEEGLEILLNDKNYACLLDTLYLYTDYLCRYYDNATGEDLLEVVPEKAFEFYIAHMASRDSPLIGPLNQYILKWIESGFADYHIERATDDNHKVYYEKHKKGLTSSNKYKSLSIGELMSVFILYGCMIFICILAFVLELSYFYISKSVATTTGKFY